MKNIVKIGIRIFILFSVFHFINYIVLSIDNIINIYESNKVMNIDITFNYFIMGFLPVIIIWCLFIFFIVFLWIKCDAIVNKIINFKESENINISLDYKNALSVGIILIGIFLIIDSIPVLFSYISNLTISKTRFVDANYLRKYTIKEIVEIIGVLIKIVISYLIIRYNGILIDKIVDTGNKKQK